MTAQPSSSHTKAPSLKEQIEWAALGLQRVAQGQSARDVVTTWPTASPVRPGAQALLYTALRHWGQTRAVIALLAKKKPQPPIDMFLAVALTLLLEPQGVSYAPFTVVNQTVEALRRSKKWQAQAGFVNACLRRFLRERDTLLSAIDGDVAARTNHPAWWVECVRQDHPHDWERILEASNARAPLTLRVNVARIDRDAYLALLTGAGVEAIPVLEAGVMLRKAVDVRDLPGYAQGWFSVQDAAAQRAAALLLGGCGRSQQESQPLLILDACAAPGGKTAHLLEWAAAHQLHIELIAMEVDAQRASRIADNMQRLGFDGQLQVEVADAANTGSWQQPVLKGRLLDAVLLDAPCSASGIVRRHPDIRWLRRPQDLDALVSIQALILKNLWALLKPGGRLLYCTCSIFHREGQDQIRQFLAQHADATQVGELLQLLPGGLEAMPLVEDHDGFFYGLLQKAS
ncbi:16S rRNA (cytosine(967)-C(5))-methyltransferase RsmB [Lampropedia puyangensis]|nr:16S rRNA (cytosine(967)-C(5))-methyltransferase RsmB [Lampropedia puyangensis]